MLDIPTITQIVEIIDEYVRAEDKYHRLLRIHGDLYKMYREHDDHRDEIRHVMDLVSTMVSTYGAALLVEAQTVGREVRLPGGRPRITDTKTPGGDLNQPFDSNGRTIRPLDFSNLGDDDLLTLDEVSILMNKSPSTIYGWGRDKKIEPEKNGQTNVYRVRDLKAMIGKKRPVGVSEVRDLRGRGGKARWTPKGETFEDLKNRTSTADLQRRKAEGRRRRK